MEAALRQPGNGSTGTNFGISAIAGVRTRPSPTNRPLSRLTLLPWSRGRRIRDSSGLRDEAAAGQRHRIRQGLVKGRPTGAATMPRREHRASDQRRRPQDIAACRNAAIEEFEGGPRLLTRAFRNVAEAQGGVSEIARRADIDRVDVPRGLSAKTGPDSARLPRSRLPAECGLDLWQRSDSGPAVS